MIPLRVCGRNAGRIGMRRFADWGSMREAFDVESPKPAAAARQAAAPAAPKATPAATAAATPAASTNGGNSTISAFFKDGNLGDTPPPSDESSLNWSSSFHGLGNTAFPEEAQKVLSQAIEPDDVEITPDGLLYLPEIKYRRILNRAFGAGGWGLAPRSETLVSKQGLGGLLTREYALVVNGRLVSIARGEQQFFADKGIPTATEGCKSNALMRCCKDLGIASELWDPRFIRAFKRKHCEDVFVEHIPTKKKKKIWKRKDETVEYPFKQ